MLTNQPAKGFVIQILQRGAQGCFAKENCQEDIIGRSDYGLMSPETVKNFKNDDKRVIESGQIQTFEAKFTTAEMNKIYLTTKAPYRDHEGNVIGVFGISRDITELKLIEDKIRSEHSFRKAIEDSILAGITAADLNGQIIYVNPAFCQMVGWTEEELVGSMPPFVFWPPEETENISKIFKKRLQDMGPREIEYVFCRRNGERFPVSVLVSPLTDGHGKVVGIVASFHDITDKRKMEEELVKVQKLESLGLLAGGIAHDFNNILTGIIGNISLAKTWMNPEDQAFHRLNEAEKASHRATELARQLLTFAKGGASIKKTAPIREVLENSVKFALSGSNVVSEISFGKDLWPVEIDEGQISQVIQNLAINAQQSMPAGGTIHLKARNMTIEEKKVEGLSLRKGNYVEISIQDQGVGIPKELLSKIFDPYFTTKQKGSGLGLAISHSIIQRHDGFITVKSKLGVGTTFFLYLPASRYTIVPKNAEKEDLVSGKGKVLIIDDEESILDVAGEMLRHLGYEVETALSGTKALKKYKMARDSGQPFDVVITDLTIPGDIGGIEALERLKTIDSQVRVIVSSGYSNDPALANFKSYGFYDFITKPYRVIDLSRTLNRVLNIKR